VDCTHSEVSTLKIANKGDGLDRASSTVDGQIGGSVDDQNLLVLIVLLYHIPSLFANFGRKNYRKYSG